MSKFYTILTWVSLSLSYFGSASWCPHNFFQQTNGGFDQKTNQFWEYEEKTNSWVEVKLPFDLVSCVNDNCTKVGSIHRKMEKQEANMEKEGRVSEQIESLERKEGSGGLEINSEIVLPQRKRLSLTKMSETSIWVTGESGSIYERFWNGVQWVIAPHDLPISASHAISVFIVNQTILALSEQGNLYQMQLSESSEPIWVEFIPTPDHRKSRETEQSSAFQIKSGVVSPDGERVYFCTKNGSLLELREIQPPRWENHGRPPGANVAAIADAGTIRSEVVFTISSSGDLYEHDRNSRPTWKKHIKREGTTQDVSLLPETGCSLHGSSGTHSRSLFLLTEGGDLVERRLHQRKWRWIFHGSPKDHHLTSITSVSQDELNEVSYSLFFTTATGHVFEYRVPKHSGPAQKDQIIETWVSHIHPLHAKAARSVSGLQYEIGRILFPLNDGRIAELHLLGMGGESTGPTHQVTTRKKKSYKYIWSVLDAPETEGWNAEYCTEERGPSNCITGIKDEPNDSEDTRPMTRRRKATQSQKFYLSPSESGSISAKSSDNYKLADNLINTNFRLRAMHGGRSLFLITDGGLTFEYIHTENVWLWLRHEHPTAMKGALGNYNGSLFLVDTNGSLLMRERSNNELAWINCTSMRKGRQVNGGPPWDGMPGKAMKVTAEDALFFVSRTGRLLQFRVSRRKFKWKDCRYPPNTKIACIIDQEVFRENIVFVVGRNGRLYQYNKVTELWHEHYQSQHLVLSRSPGTAVRPSSLSLIGSLFMLSEDGGLVEYHWNPLEGWNWVEHGTPYKNVTLIGSPGPCFGGNQLFLIGSDGKAYLRYLDQTTWKWKNCGFPYMENMVVKIQRQVEARHGKEEICVDEDFGASLENDENINDLNKNCDPKVAPTRPVPFSEDSVIFELRDGRLGEMRRVKDKQWVWSRTIGTPTSLCIAKFWTALAS